MRIYLAGPEVFLKNCSEVFQAKKSLCRSFNMEGVSPFDAEISDIQNDKPSGLRICQANEHLIQSCGAIIANTTPFRGQNVDVGTAIEIGYARALGKRVFAYTNSNETHASRLVKRMYFDHVRRDGPLLRETFWHSSIDDFEMTDNLMVDGSVLGSGGQVMVTEKSSYPDWTDQVADLTGFSRCLEALSRALASERRGLAQAGVVGGSSAASESP